MTIKEVQDRITSIYSKINKTCGHDQDFFFSYLTRTIASAFKQLKYNSDPSNKFVKAIAYLFGLAELYKMDIQDCFLKRFPNICPYCLTSPCQCLQTNKKSLLNISQRKYQDELFWKHEIFIQDINSKNITFDFDYCVDSLHSIYPLNKLYWKIFRGPEFHINKCLEELGEIQETYSKCFTENYKFEYQVQDEICDLFAWILSAWRLSCPTLEITSYIVKFYKDGCPNCNQEVCNCVSRHNKSDMILEKNEIEVLYTLLDKLDKTTEVNNLLLQIKNSLASNSITEYKICVGNAIAIFNNMQQNKANKNVDDINKVLNLYRTKI